MEMMNLDKRALEVQSQQLKVADQRVVVEGEVLVQKQLVLLQVRMRHERAESVLKNRGSTYTDTHRPTFNKTEQPSMKVHLLLSLLLCYW